MGYKVDNAIIMAAGFSSRFVPISYEKPKALIKVKEEVLIERQIRQLQEKNIHEIIVVTGYKKKQLFYLQKKYGVILIENPQYKIRNNHSSIYAARHYLKNTYICSADNYFVVNPFEKEVNTSYYAAMFARGKTKEWCIQTDSSGWINGVHIGGINQWYMIGQAFWDELFSKNFIRILESIYEDQSTKNKLWEDIYCEHLSELRMKIKKYKQGQIYEFDSLDELRLFDERYLQNSDSYIMKKISEILKCGESDIINIQPIKNENADLNGMTFQCNKMKYEFNFTNQTLKRLENK